LEKLEEEGPNDDDVALDEGWDEEKPELSEGSCEDEEEDDEPGFMGLTTIEG
jgi:hypothetical protein